LGAIQQFPLNIAIALATATASYYLVELPCINGGKSLRWPITAAAPAASVSSEYSP